MKKYKVAVVGATGVVGNEMIKMLEERLYTIDDRIESTQSPKITGLPGGGLRHSLEDDLIKREEIENRINTLLKESKPIRLEILDRIDHLKNVRDAQVLEMYFVDDTSMVTIANKLGYSLSSIKTWYSDGVYNIDITQ